MPPPPNAPPSTPPEGTSATPIPPPPTFPTASDCPPNPFYSTPQPLCTRPEFAPKAPSPSSKPLGHGGGAVGGYEGKKHCVPKMGLSLLALLKISFLPRGNFFGVWVSGWVLGRVGGPQEVWTTTTRRRWRNRNGGVKTAAWRTFRRRSALHRAVKNKRVTVQGPVKKPQMDYMSHRGSHPPPGPPPTRS